MRLLSRCYSPLRMGSFNMQRFSTLDSLCPTISVIVLSMNSEDGASQRKGPSKDRFSEEIRGYIELGMQREALGLARRFLKRDPLEPEAFNAALDGLLVQGDRLKRWSRTVESAYARLTRKAKRDASSMMLAFYYSTGEFANAQALVPKRLDATVSFQDLAFGIEVFTEMNRLNDASKLVRRVIKRVDLTQEEWSLGLLMGSLAEFYARIGDWEQAIEFWQPLRTHRGLAESAILGIVEVRVAQALRAVREGLASLREMRANPEPALAIAVPGNEESRWEKTQQKLIRLEKRVRKVLARDRQREGWI